MTTDPDVNACSPPASGGSTMGKEGMVALVEVLTGRGFTVIGPTVQDGAIVLAELESADELPYGWGVELEAGRYRLRERADGAAFANAAGPQSWKQFLHPAKVRQWRADRVGEEIVFTAEEPPAPRYAFLGVRPCDARAIAVQDRVLTGGPTATPPTRGGAQERCSSRSSARSPAAPASVSRWARDPRPRPAVTW